MKQLSGGREVLAARINSVLDLVREFREYCEEREYTDVGDVWDVLEDIECALQGASANGENGDLERRPHPTSPDPEK